MREEGNFFFFRFVAINDLNRGSTRDEYRFLLLPEHDFRVVGQMKECGLVPCLLSVLHRIKWIREEVTGFIVFIRNDFLN